MTFWGDFIFLLLYSYLSVFYVYVLNFTYVLVEHWAPSDIGGGPYQTTAATHGLCSV